MRTSAPSATVVVPTYRGVDRIGGLLDSLAEQTLRHQVIVVDNGSADGTSRVLQGYREIEVIRLEQNIGFGRAVNLAAREASGEALVLVNDDCLCDERFVEAIVGPLGGETVMSAGVMRMASDAELIDSAGMELGATLNVFDYLHSQPVAALDAAPSPIGPTAAAAAFDRQAFLEVGGFDEAFFAYWEDVDLMLRLRLEGADCALATDAQGMHAHSATLGPGSAKKNRLMGFGRGYLLRKWSVMHGARALRVLAEDGAICAGQALIDHNLAGVRGRIRGASAARRTFAFPEAILREHWSVGLIEDLRRRLRRRGRILRSKEETPRQGLERQLGAGSPWKVSAGEAFAAELTVAHSDPIRVGRGNLVFLGGRMTPLGGRDGGVELLVDGVPSGDPVTVVNPGPGEFAFWWTALELLATTDPGKLRLALRIRDGHRGELAELPGVEIHPNGRPETERGSPRIPTAVAAAEGRSLVAICMATCEPRADLFSEQIESIKRQTHRDWVCLISDDRSSAERRAEMRDAIGDDERFVFLEDSGQRVGFYRNFERALEAVPSEAERVAFADQDDRWDPDKLETLIRGLSDRDLVFSDMRIVGEDGALISDTYWNRRRNNYTDLASLLVGNTVTGAASLFRADLLEYALPFPAPFSDSYHDHWVALCAMTRGGLAYVDRPLQDYVQHGGSAQGHEEANAGASYLQLHLIAVLAWQGLWALLGRHGTRGWAERYFGMYTRTRIWARALLMRSEGSLARRQRRILERVAHADRAPTALLWLAGRSLRPIWGANEAFGRELLVLTSVLWAEALRLRSGTGPLSPFRRGSPFLAQGRSSSTIPPA